MARTRLLHPDAPCDEDVASLMPCARLVWAYLPCHADRAGRLADKPFKLKLAILPTDSVDMDQILGELAARNLIVRYEANGKRYIAIRSFLRYQHPHRNEIESDIPPPPENTEAPSKVASAPFKTAERPERTGGDDPDPVIDTVVDLKPERSPKGTELVTGEVVKTRKAPEYPPDYERIWAETGRSGNKFPAFEEWKKLGRPPADAVIAGWRRAERHDKRWPNYIPHLSTWLHARGWEDDPAQSRAPPGYSDREVSSARASMEWLEGK